MLGGGDLLICDALVSRDGFGGSYGQGATLPGSGSRLFLCVDTWWAAVEVLAKALTLFLLPTRLDSGNSFGCCFPS